MMALTATDIQDEHDRLGYDLGADGRNSNCSIFTVKFPACYMGRAIGGRVRQH